MRILVDMNLSPVWVSVLMDAGHVAMHWSTVGAPSASDAHILAWARDNGHILFTHDLDFGAILAATNAAAPSVIQIRTQDITPEHASGVLLAALARFASQLEEGVLISVDEERARARVLPLKRP